MKNKVFTISTVLGKLSVYLFKATFDFPAGEMFIFWKYNKNICAKS